MLLLTCVVNHPGLFLVGLPYDFVYKRSVAQAQQQGAQQNIERDPKNFPHLKNVAQRPAVNGRTPEPQNRFRVS